MQPIVSCRRGWFLLVAILPLLGCSRPATGPAVEEGPKQYVVGVSLPNLADPWWTQTMADIEAAAAKRSDLRLIVADAKDNVATQRNQLEVFLRNRVNAVIVSPKDAQAITQPVAKLFDQGIPVVVLDRAVIGDKYSCFIAADPVEIGTAAGKWLAERLQGKGNIVELRGPVDSLWDQQLHTAWRAALRDPGYRFVFDGHVDPPRMDAGKLMSEALGRIEKIDAVFAYDDAAGAAAHEVAKTAGRVKGVLFLGIGGLPKQGAADVAQGVLSVSFLRPTGGAEAIDAAATLLRGEKTPKKITPPTRPISNN